MFGPVVRNRGPSIFWTLALAPISILFLVFPSEAFAEIGNSLGEPRRRLEPLEFLQTVDQLHLATLQRMPSENGNPALAKSLLALLCDSCPANRLPSLILKWQKTFAETSETRRAFASLWFLNDVVQTSGRSERFTIREGYEDHLDPSAFVGELPASSKKETVAPEKSFETADKRVRFRLKRPLGRGFFGEVWEAVAIHRGTGQTESVTLKFYHRPAEAEAQVRTLREVGGVLGPSGARNLMPARSALTVSDLSGNTFLVVPGVLGDGDLASLRATAFAPHGSEAERERRIGNLRQLTNDLIAATRQLAESGLVHHDLNPRNVIRVNGVYRANDLEGVTLMGSAPPAQSWELTSGAPEYGGSQAARPDLASAYGPLSDLWTAASTVYFAAFGETPLEAFARSEFSGEFANDHARAVTAARERLLASPEARERFRARVRDVIEKYGAQKNTPKALRDFSEVARFLTAALEPEPLKRKELLGRVMPELPQLKFSYAEIGLAPSFSFAFANAQAKHPLSAGPAVLAPQPCGVRLLSVVAHPAFTVPIGAAGGLGIFVYGARRLGKANDVRAKPGQEESADEKAPPVSLAPLIWRAQIPRSEGGAGCSEQEAQRMAAIAIRSPDPVAFLADWIQRREDGQDE